MNQFFIAKVTYYLFPESSRISQCGQLKTQQPHGGLGMQTTRVTHPYTFVRSFPLLNSWTWRIHKWTACYQTTKNISTTSKFFAPWRQRTVKPQFLQILRQFSVCTGCSILKSKIWNDTFLCKLAKNNCGEIFQFQFLHSAPNPKKTFGQF